MRYSCRQPRTICPPPGRPRERAVLRSAASVGAAGARHRPSLPPRGCSAEPPTSSAAVLARRGASVSGDGTASRPTRPRQPDLRRFVDPFSEFSLRVRRLRGARLPVAHRLHERARAARGAADRRHRRQELRRRSDASRHVANTPTHGSLRELTRAGASVVAFDLTFADQGQGRQRARRRDSRGRCHSRRRRRGASDRRRGHG